MAVGDTFIASASFADDVTLVATSLEEVAFLVDGYRQWCGLLGVKLNAPKTQVWTNKGAGRRVTLKFGGEQVTLTSRPTFRVVGIELGDHERTATTAHVASRLAKALQTGRRPASLNVPAAVSSSMWRTTVLPQGLYGSEIRHVTPAQLRPLCMQGKNLVTQKLNITLAAPEVLGGVPLGACAVRDPRLEALARRIHWLVKLSPTAVSVAGQPNPPRKSKGSR